MISLRELYKNSTVQVLGDLLDVEASTYTDNR